jgi:hypothetical protein
MVIVWENEAKRELRKIYDYIRQDSYQNAIKVRDEIIDLVLSLSSTPAKFPFINTKKKTMEAGGPLNFIVSEFHTVLWQMKSVSFA